MTDNYFSMILVCQCFKPKARCTCKPEDEGEYDHLDVAPHLTDPQPPDTIEE